LHPVLFSLEEIFFAMRHRPFLEYDFNIYEHMIWDFLNRHKNINNPKIITTDNLIISVLLGEEIVKKIVKIHKLTRW
jgi:hypothetical protein